MRWGRAVGARSRGEVGTGGGAAGTTNPKGRLLRGGRGGSAAERGPGPEGHAPAAGSALGETMSGGSSCSQTPSRAIPTTGGWSSPTRAAAPRGLQHHPGGTLSFQHHPGVGRGPGEVAPAPRLWVRAVGSSDSERSGRRSEPPAGRGGKPEFRGAVIGKNGTGYQGGSESGRWPQGASMGVACDRQPSGANSIAAAPATPEFSFLGETPDSRIVDNAQTNARFQDHHMLRCCPLRCWGQF